MGIIKSLSILMMIYGQMKFWRVEEELEDFSPEAECNLNLSLSAKKEQHQL